MAQSQAVDYQLRTMLQNAGISAMGASQLIEGQPVTDAADRQVVRALLVALGNGGRPGATWYI